MNQTVHFLQIQVFVKTVPGKHLQLIFFKPCMMEIFITSGMQLYGTTPVANGIGSFQCDKKMFPKVYNTQLKYVGISLKRRCFVL